MTITRRDILKGAAVFGVLSLLPDELAALPVAAAKWESLTSQFLLEPKLVYLNNGSLGPSPLAVVNSVVKAIKTLETNPVVEAYGSLLKEAEQARLKVVDFLHCDQGELAITRNTTEAMNEIAQGIDFSPGDHILMTDQEHPGGKVGWEYVAKRHDLVIDKVKLTLDDTPATILKKFRQSITGKTRVISFSHVTYSTGCRLPAKAICDLAREKGCLSVIDAAQSAGVLPVDLHDIGCDAAGGSSHKWLLAPKGTGFLYVRKASQAQIRPLLTSHGMRVYTASTGTRNIPGVIGIGAAVDFITSLGIGKVEQHALQLTGMLRDRLKSLPGIQFLSPEAPALRSALLSFYFSNRKTVDVIKYLAKQNITVKTLHHGRQVAIRISCHCYNDAGQMEKLVEALG